MRLLYYKFKKTSEIVLQKILREYKYAYYFTGFKNKGISSITANVIGISRDMLITVGDER